MYEKSHSARIYGPGFKDINDHAISWNKDLLSQISRYEKATSGFSSFEFLLISAEMIPEMWNIHGSNEIMSLNNIFSRSTFDIRFNYMRNQDLRRTAYKSFPPASYFGIIESQGGWKVTFLHIQKTKHSNTGQKVNTTSVSYDMTDLFSLHGFVDCFLVQSSYWSCCITPVHCQMKINISTFYQNIGNSK